MDRYEEEGGNSNGRRSQEGGKSRHKYPTYVILGDCYQHRVSVVHILHFFVLDGFSGPLLGLEVTRQPLDQRGVTRARSSG